MKTKDQLFVGSPHAVSRLVGETMVLLDLSTDKYFGLPNAGARMWELLSEGATLIRVADVIASEYEVAREQAHHDAQKLAAKLVEAGLLLPVSSAESTSE